MSVQVRWIRTNAQARRLKPGSQDGLKQLLLTPWLGAKQMISRELSHNAQCPLCSAAAFLEAAMDVPARPGSLSCNPTSAVLQ